MEKKIIKKIEKLHDEGRHEEIVNILENMELDKEGCGLLGRALNNTDRYEEALKILFSEKGIDKNDFFWNQRVAYSAYNLKKDEDSIKYSKKALDIYPNTNKDDKIKMRIPQLYIFIYYSFQELNTDPKEILDFLDKYPAPDCLEWNEFKSYNADVRGDIEQAIKYGESCLELLELELSKEITDESKKIRLIQENNRIRKYLCQIFYDNKYFEKFSELRDKSNFTDAMFDVVSYSDEEFEAYKKHVEKHFGKIEKTFWLYPYEYVKSCLFLILPTTKRPYITLITCGMGARMMGMLTDEYKKDYGRIELFMCLPDNWDIYSDNAENYWPKAYLEALIKLPFAQESFLGLGHTIGYPSAIPGTNFKGFFLTYPYEHGEESHSLEISNEEKIKIYNVIPLYEEEIEYKENHGYEELESLFLYNPMVLDIKRDNLGFSDKTEDNIIFQ